MFAEIRTTEKTIYCKTVLKSPHFIISLFMILTQMLLPKLFSHMVPLDALNWGMTFIILFVQTRPILNVLPNKFC